MKSVLPGNVMGRLKAPPSKSMAQRAVAAAALNEGESTILMGTPCDDIESALRAAAGLGALVKRSPGVVSVQGRQQVAAARIDCGEAGLCLRMFSAVAALFDGEVCLDARGSLARRPVDMLAGPLQQLGALCVTDNGLPPVRVRGPLQRGVVQVDATESSQFLTGLLIALAHLEGESMILAPGLKSKPYVQMTVDLLREMGARIETEEELEKIRIWGKSAYAPFLYDVPGDWSGASFLVVAAAVAGELTITGLDGDSSQADRKIVDAAAAAGAEVTLEKGAVTVKRAALRGFAFDATHCPDLFPPLAALAANCEGVTRIRGVHRLTNKESNREQAIISEFGKMGIEIATVEDVMHITGGQVRGATVDSHNDHRMAMAAAVAALTASETIHIEGHNCINKSYPDFFVDMANVGAKIQ